MSSGIDLYNDLKRQVDMDYDIYISPDRGSVLLTQAYSMVVKRFLEENGRSKKNLFELRFLNIRDEVQTPTSGVLAFSSMDFSPNQFYLVKAKYVTDRGTFYNHAEENPIRKESTLINPNERYPEYEIVGETIVFYPSTVTECTLNYYKQTEPIDATDATELDIDQNLTYTLIQEAIQLAAQPARDAAEFNISQTIQNKT